MNEERGAAVLNDAGQGSGSVVAESGDGQRRMPPVFLHVNRIQPCGTGHFRAALRYFPLMCLGHISFEIPCIATITASSS